MASASYAQLVAKTSSLLFDHEDLKGIITAAKAGDMLAVLDRNDLEGEWRNARLLRRRAHMQVKAHGRRWPTAGRFGFFGAIVNRLREVFWGVERDDLEMILFTLHPFHSQDHGINYKVRTAVRLPCADHCS